jgi:cytochrome c-type biogenesis protein
LLCAVIAMLNPVPVELSLPERAKERTHVWPQFLLGLGFFGALALAGYGIFVSFVARAGDVVAAGYLVLAAVAGAGAFFSPCSFPLLPSYFAYAQVAVSQPEASRSARPRLLGLSAAAGVVSFNAILGSLFGLVGLGVAQAFLLVAPSPSAATIVLRSIVATFVLFVGIVQIRNLSLHGARLDRILGVFKARRRPRDPFIEFFLYGFAYTVIGIGCSAPFLATVIAVSLAAGGLFQALEGFLVFSLTMASLMVLMSLLATGRHRQLLRDLSARTPTIKRVGGIVLTASGAALIILTAWPALLRPLFP